MADEVHHPHDKLFRDVFSDTEEARGLLRTALPGRLRKGMDWKSLALLEGTFVDDDLKGSEADLLYEVRYGGAEEPMRLYVLLEHQSTPDWRMPFRLLKYCCRIWDADLREEGRRQLRPIVPLVFYQGSRGWTHSTELADLFPEAAREWPWVPRFEHVLLDQTKVEPGDVRGSVRGRVAQLLMMAAYGRHAAVAMEMAGRLLGRLRRKGQVDYPFMFLKYVMATQDAAAMETFRDTLRRHGRDYGEDMISYAQQLLEEGRTKGLREGEQRGTVKAVEGFLQRGVTWDVIEGATGLNETAYEALKKQLEAS